MRGYIKSVTKTFEERTTLFEIEKWTLEQFDSTSSTDPSSDERTTKRYRVTIAEVEEPDWDALRDQRRKNLQSGRNARWPDKIFSSKNQ